MIKFLPITLTIIFVASTEFALADRYSDCNQLEKPDLTIRSCTKIIKRGKKESRKNRGIAYNSRGIAYANRGQHDRAIKDFSKAIQLNTKDSVAYTNRGIVYAIMGQYDRAIEDSG